MSALPSTASRIFATEGDIDTAGRLRAEFVARGAAVLGPAALDPHVHAALVAGARQQREARAWSLYAAPQHRGEIAQDNLRGHLDTPARELLAHPTVLDLLHAVTGERLAPSWSASCYTYYSPGQHMGEHCDKVDACRYGMLVYLESRWPEGTTPSAGLQLHVFRGDNSATELLVRITSLANRIVILNGAMQAHLRPPLAPGEELVMLAGCYRLATG